MYNKTLRTMTDAQYQHLVKKARQTNTERDKHSLSLIAVIGVHTTFVQKLSLTYYTHNLRQ